MSTTPTPTLGTGPVPLVEETPYRWRIEQRPPMRVPGIVIASRALLPDIEDDRSLEQVANVATLPGVVEASFAMPDVHWGYGFPIGGVAATDVAAGGVVSPGGVGFDIACGVRLLAAPLSADDLRGRLPALMDALDEAVPRGIGRGGVWGAATPHEMTALLTRGARYVLERGQGEPRDLARCEDRGVLAGAEPGRVSERALDRGRREVGSLGSGNHFLEVQVVEGLYDAPAAHAYGLGEGQVCVMIHCGSRGLGHQVCADHVRLMQPAMRRHGIVVPDRQLACAPVESPEGQAYLGAMLAAANFGRANRQVLADAVRRVFAAVFGRVALDLVYDVAHNLAHLETHPVGGRPRRLCVHRKGATRARPPGHPDLPADLSAHGQPVLLPGSMGTASWVMAGEPGGPAFGSACHGAGRVMSRHEATRRVRGATLRAELEAGGVQVRASSLRGLAEEAPFSYKDIDEVVSTCAHAGLARRVARLRPVGVVKG